MWKDLSENKFYLYSKHILIAMNINSLLLIIFLIFATSCAISRQSENLMPAVQSSMIWSTSEIAGDGGYVVFRKSFDLADANSPAQLQLFADSRYILWINGQYVLRGPCRFNPKRPEYDVVDIRPHLKKGKNVMVAMVHHYGNVINEIGRAHV